MTIRAGLCLVMADCLSHQLGCVAEIQLFFNVRTVGLDCLYTER